MEAGRLRRRLERYYLTEGQGDAVRIDLPKGSYVPLFRVSFAPAAAAAPAEHRVASAPGDAAFEPCPSGPSIAVLPLREPQRRTRTRASFADGITEEIINALTCFPNLRVIARHSTFKYKGQHVDIREVGRDLGVRYVLEGSVRKGGEHWCV